MRPSLKSLSHKRDENFKDIKLKNVLWKKEISGMFILQLIIVYCIFMLIYLGRIYAYHIWITVPGLELRISISSTPSKNKNKKNTGVYVWTFLEVINRFKSHMHVLLKKINPVQNHSVKRKTKRTINSNQRYWKFEIINWYTCSADTHDYTQHEYCLLSDGSCCRVVYVHLSCGISCVKVCVNLCIYNDLCWIYVSIYKCMYNVDVCMIVSHWRII